MRLPNDLDALGRIGLFAPSLYDRAVRQNQAAPARRYKELKTAAVPWDDELKFQEDLVIRGETYPNHALKDLPTVKDHTRIPADPAERWSLSPTMHYYHTRLPAGTALDVYMGRRRGHVWFTAPVTVPVLAEGVPGSGRPPKVWMSHTPTEFFSQRAGIRRATGVVLVGGLGLGWFLRKVCQRPSVKRVILVEQNQAVLEAFQPALTARCPELAKVSDWILGDALEHVGRHGDDVRHLLDIWDSYGEYDKRFFALKKTTRHLWGWGVRD